MTVDEMIIQVRVTAEGVKQGVAAAAGELKKLEAEKERLRRELEFKINAAGIPALQEDLKALEAGKKKLEQKISFPVESENAAELKQTLKEIEEEKAKLEKTVNTSIDAAAWDKAYERLRELEGVKNELSGELELTVKTEAEAAKQELKNITNNIAGIEREISVKLETEGINKAAAELQGLDGQIKSAEQSGAELDKAMTKLGFTAGAVFAGIIAAAKSGLDAYMQTAEAQTKLTHIMGLTMGAASGQVKEVIKLTQEYEKLGVISAGVQQAGAQELATYLSKTESLKALIPVMNDVSAQQYGYSASAEQVRNVATTLGKVMDGQTGALSRYGYSFSEVQEEILKTGTEAERVATLMEVVASSVGGTNEALGQTDAGKIAALGTEAGNAAKAFGGALIPAIADFAEILTGIVSAVTRFIEGNKEIVAGLVVVVGGYAIATLAVAAYTKAVAAASLANKAFNLSNPVGWIALAAGGIAAAVTAYNNHKQAQEELRQKQEALTKAVEDYNRAMREGISEDNIAAVESHADMVARLSEELKKSKAEALETAEALGFKDANHLFKAKLQEMKTELEALGFSYDTAISGAENYEKALELLNNGHNEAATALRGYKKAQEEAEQAEAERIAKQEQLDKLQDDYINSTNELSRAYKTLKDGEQLSYEAMLSLIDNYPILAKHIATEGRLTSENAELLKEAWAEKQRILRQERESEAEQLQTQLENARKIVEAKQAVAMAGAFASSAEFMQSEKEAQEAQSRLDELTKKYNKLIADINAIDNDKPFEYKPKGGGADKPEKEDKTGPLEKELKLLDERRKLGELTAEQEMEELERIRAAYAKTAAEKAQIDRQLYDTAVKNLSDRKALTQMSAREELDELLRIAKLYAQTAGDKLDIDKQVYAQRLRVNDEWYTEEMAAIARLNRGRAENTDFAEIISRLEEMKEKAVEVYADYPERLAAIEEQIDDLMLDSAEKRADKLLKIETDSVDARIKELQRLADLARDGVEISGGQIVLTGDSAAQRVAKEKEYWEEIVRTTKEQIDKLKQMEGELDGERHKKLQEYLSKYTQYVQKVEDLGIQLAKELQKEQEKTDADKQKALEKALEDERKAREKAAKDEEQRLKDLLKQKTDAAKEASKVYIQELKDRYTQELRLAEDAANAEIAACSDKIKAIDDLMKAESRAEADGDSEDKIRRLEERLKYETDDANIYELQKQIAAEKTEYEKRKRRESLEDEKASLQEQITAVKDSLAQHKQELQDLRDNEIRLAEESLAAYIADLEEKYAERAEFAEAETAVIRKELEKQAGDSQHFADKEYALQKQAQEDKRALFQKTTAEILQDLRDKIDDFANAGWLAGQAFANAYRSAVSSINASIAGYYASNTPESAAYPETPEAGTINVYNTFTMPVATPSKVAAETAYSLEMMTRV